MNDAKERFQCEKKNKVASLLDGINALMILNHA